MHKPFPGPVSLLLGWFQSLARPHGEMQVRLFFPPTTYLPNLPTTSLLYTLQFPHTKFLPVPQPTKRLSLQVFVGASPLPAVCFSGFYVSGLLLPFLGSPLSGHLLWWPVLTTLSEMVSLSYYLPHFCLHPFIAFPPLL